MLQSIGCKEFGTTERLNNKTKNGRREYVEFAVGCVVQSLF